MENVLLPVNGTPSSDHAVDEVIRHLKEGTSAMELHLLNVQQRNPEANDLDRQPALPFETGLAQLQSARDKLEQAKIPYRFHIVMGDPAEKILTFCDEIQCTRIIMGSRNPRSAVRFLLDKVSEHVRQRAKVPVLVVPQGEVLPVMQLFASAKHPRTEPQAPREVVPYEETVTLELTAEGLRKLIQDIVRMDSEPCPPTFPYRNDFLIAYRIWSQLKGIHKLLLGSVTFQEAKKQPETPAARQLAEFEQMLVTTIEAMADIQVQILHEQVASAEQYMHEIQKVATKFEQEASRQLGYW